MLLGPPAWGLSDIDTVFIRGGREQGDVPEGDVPESSRAWAALRSVLRCVCACASALVCVRARLRLRALVCVRLLACACVREDASCAS